MILLKLKFIFSVTSCLSQGMEVWNKPKPYFANLRKKIGLPTIAKISINIPVYKSGFVGALGFIRLRAIPNPIKPRVCSIVGLLSVLESLKNGALYP